MTAITLLAEEPAIGAPMTWFLIKAVSFLFGLLAVYCWLVARVLSSDDDDDVDDDTRRVELGAAALGKGAKR